MSDILVDQEFRSIVPPLSQEEYEGLEASLIKEGNRTPIDTWRGYIVDGHHRYDICHKHNIPLKPANELQLEDRDEVMLWIIDNQLARRNLPLPVRLELIITSQEIELRRQARERKQEAGELYHKGSPKVTQMFVSPLEDKPKHRQDEAVDAIIARKAGTSRETVRKYRDVMKKATPEQKEKLASGKATVNQVYQSVKRDEVKEHVKQIEWPEGKYRVIYADPPWQYDNKMPVGSSMPEDHYPTQGLEVIKQMPVKNIALDNSVLFLWSPAPMIIEALELVKAWGFEYKAQFVWDKVKHNMGNYNSVRHELLLICTRGSCMPDSSELIDSVQTIERGQHSVKPEQFRNIITQMYPYGPRIELFSRVKVDGWHTWGNQL